MSKSATVDKLFQPLYVIFNLSFSEYTNSRETISKTAQNKFGLKKVFFGGYNIHHHARLKSQSQTKFDGCLQDVVVNNV